MEQLPIKLLAYSWHGDKLAKYLKWHKFFVENILRIELDITHLGLQVGDAVYHSFSGSAPDNRKAHWISRKVSERVYKEPKYEIDLGYTDKNLSFAWGLTADNRTPVWSIYVWFYSFGLIKIKKDCVSSSRTLINYMAKDVPTLKAESPYGLLKELENHGYGSA